MNNLIKDLERIVDEDQQKLRDHFAGLAMQGLISALASPSGYENITIDMLAKEAYLMADAMLKVRKEASND